MNDFLESIMHRDPAAKSKISIILTYPGVKSVFFHKIAHTNEQKQLNTQN